ncbi:hypothetical protein WS48_06355 [Burkholderia sp. RF7-non_BP1]|nr:hypothetical protein WS45_15885 [Burkholderia sp. RF2-non_BP3]KUY84274.1 hypothetical protein WS46_09410 [Burkholderia sp. RF4-BP95]KUZ00699.1 hypothetical protein WS48_06355 [Burkholderia sp. RF7-non_BP1]KUZ04476.1 hypothetical protein WS49_08905 [Burkholderia sp. RF7-non_BP4]
MRGESAASRENVMLFGVVIWVALAALFPTMVVPTIQHAIQPSSAQAAPDASPAATPAALPAAAQPPSDG